MKKSYLYSILGIFCLFPFHGSYSQIIPDDFSLQNKADRLIELDTIINESTMLDIFDSGKGIGGLFMKLILFWQDHSNLQWRMPVRKHAF